MARFCLRVHTLKVEQATWDDTVSLASSCDLCDARDDVQDEQHCRSPRFTRPADQGLQGLQGKKRPQSRRLTASLFINTHE
eukprot:396357-Pelagomonas_calceolata.AAC.1